MWRWVWLFIALFAAELRAGCPVSVIVTGPDDHGVVTLTANSHGECGASTVAIDLDGSRIDSKECTNASDCTLVTSLSALCMKSGPHVVTATGGCQHKDSTGCPWDPAGGSATSSFDVDNTPGVTLAYDGPDPSGHGKVTIGWHFRNNGFGHVQFLVDGSLQFEQWELGHPDGTWSFDYGFTCAKPGTHVLTARALACGSVAPETYPSEASLIASSDVPVVVAGKTSATGVYDEDAQKLTLTTHFPYTDSPLLRHIAIHVDGAEREGDLRGCLNSVDGTCAIDLSLSCGTAHHIQIDANGCSRGDDMYNGAQSIDVAPSCTHEPSGCRVKTSTSAEIPPDDSGASCDLCPGMPVHVGTGDVSAHIPLFTIAADPMPLRFDLHYHSMRPSFPNALAYPLGPGWTHPFNTSVKAVSADRLLLLSATGDRYYFDRATPSLFLASRPAHIADTIALNDGQYIVRYPDGGSSAFDAATGHWLSTRDRWENTLSGTYDAAGDLVAVGAVTLEYSNGLLSRIALPDGSAWTLDYAPTPAGPVLHAIHDPVHPEQSWRTFAYAPQNDGVYRSLTEVRDAAGKLLEGHAYDASPFNRGLTSVSEGGRDALQFAYDVPSAGKTRVTRTIDSQTVQVTDYTIVVRKGAYVASRIDGVCPSCGSTTESKAMTVDDAGRATSVTDAGGHITRFTYDAFGNVTLKVEAAGTDLQRVTTFEYAQPGWPNFVSKMLQPFRMTEYAWSPDERTLIVTENGDRRTLTFDLHHHLISIDGPRSDVADVATRTYDTSGHLTQSVDAAGLMTTYANYDVYGTARTITAPGGLVTALETDARGRVVRKTVAGFATSTTFDAQDRIVETSTARGAKTRYAYEPGTNRLTDIIRLDFNGNEVERKHLTLNVAGDKVKEEDQSCSAPSGVCTAWLTTRTVSFAYDAKDRLAGVDGIVYSYDADGRLASVRNENGVTTAYEYDALGRLTAVIQPLATTRFGYDPQNNLTSVTDPNGAVTTFAYDGLGRLLSQSNPLTRYGYDPAGNLIVIGETARTYDAANRITSSQSGEERVTWTYDAAGRVSGMTDPTGSTDYAYDVRGLLTSERKTINGSRFETRYAYDADGNRQQITLPSGRAIDFTYDFAGRPATASTRGVPLVTSATYAPFGPARRVVYGNGTVKEMSLDARARIVENKLAGIAGYQYAYDGVGNILQIRDAFDARYNRDFTYDALNRLVSWGSRAFAYDAAGNLLPPSASFDAAGNELGGRYSARNLLASADGIEYQYDGRGIRTIATVVDTGILPLGTISGIVLAADGTPIAGATVFATPASSMSALAAGAFTAVTDEKGRFTLSLPTGAYTVTIAKADFASWTYSVTVGPGVTLPPQSVRLEPSQVATSLAYTGPSSAVVRSAVTLTARLADANGAVVSNRPVVFDFAGQVATAITNASGDAATTLVANTGPGSATVRISFAGDAAYKSSETIARLDVTRILTTIAYTGKSAITDRLVATIDPAFANAVVTFTAGAQTATAVSDAGGRAIAAMALPVGPLTVQIAFAGDTDHTDATATAKVLAYEEQSFVIWGGNARPPQPGDRVNFWGRTWAKQVSSGEYDAEADFKGWASPIDALNWTSKDGNSKPPSAIASYVSAIVATKIGKANGSTIGNIAARVVLRVEPGYRPDPGVSAYATIVDVIEDHARLFPRLQYTGPATIASGTVVSARVVDAVERTPSRSEPVSFTLGTSTVTATTDLTGVASAPLALSASAPAGPAVLTIRSGGDSIDVPVTVVHSASMWSWLHRRRRIPVSLSVADAPLSRVYLYTPELHLLAETSLTSADIVYEYVWFGGEPLAQIETPAGAIHYYFNDHLGTPLMTTDANGAVDWRAEYEPYGSISALRTPDRHQPLRRPGQEAEQFDTGANGATGRYYNVFRWYRPSSGRYTQPDPLGFAPDINLYRYALGNPVHQADMLGLDTVGCDAVRDSLETPCRLECCAAHDRCYDENHCSSASWGAGSVPGKKGRTACDYTSACSECNATVVHCFRTCGRSKYDDPKKPNYYCGAQHRFVAIPGDFSDVATATKACECDYSRGCTFSPPSRPSKPLTSIPFPHP